MQVIPYLSFEGRCEEAIEFYKTALGAKAHTILRFKDSPDCPPSGKFPPEMLNKVMHAAMQIGSTTVMATDGHCGGAANFTGTSMTISVKTDEEADRYFAALSEGGKVNMPLTKTFFSSRFGMLADRFGVPWMVVVQP